jgi:hypothetical protein
MSTMRRNRERYDGIRHVFFCFVDHFEPLWNGVDRTTAVERTRNWYLKYPSIVDSFRDGGGRPPQHNFFYPQEEYLPECLEILGNLVRKGYGSVEVHLHHNKDTSDGLRNKVEEFKRTLHHGHGLLNRHPVTGQIVYGFIHGNWALDDSWGDGKWCGVKNEISILKETGCYADFTYPSAPHRTQPPIVNRIYYATDDPSRAKSHHKGEDAGFRSPPKGDLLLINGPLAFNWRQRRKRVFPAIENGDVSGYCLPTADRVDLWVRLGVSVRGWPRWIFVKVHTHGAQEKNSGLLLSEGVHTLHRHLLGTYNNGKTHIVHYVTAWELYCCVKALESGDEDWIRRIENFDYSVNAWTGK